MRTVSLVLVAFLLAGCGVRKDLHQAALDAIAQAQDEQASIAGQLEAAKAAAAVLDGSLEECKDEVAALAEARDAVISDNAALRQQLQNAGVETEQLAAQNEATRAMLEESQRALAEARKRQASAEARDAVYRAVKERLQAMIDAGKLNVRIVRGRMVIDLKQDILFPSGRAKLSDIGEETLSEVAGVLASFPDRSFQVEGHTDNVPISTDRFPSNWELSTARAVSVVKLFVDKGMSAEAVSAAGFGEYQARADNGSEDGRALNRRIEIVMQPDLQLLPDLVDAL